MDEHDPKPFSLEALRHQQVEVIAGGFCYRGMLIGADEEDLYLKGRFQFIVLPLSRVTSIRLASEQGTFDPRKSVDARFYEDPEG